MRVVDAHVHIWDLSTGLYPGLEKPSVSFIGDNAPIARSYLIDELLAEGGAEIEIAKIVHVEAFPRDRIAETRYLQALADGPGRGFPQALVVNADLSAPDAREQLERQCAFANTRGIRQVLNRHPDPSFDYGAADHLADPVWRDNYRLLARFGLSFDLQLYPHQIEVAAAFLAEHPETPVVLNHAAMFADRTLAGWRQWRRGLGQLAALDHVSVKISGLGMLDHAWTLESLRPAIYECLDAFGPGRAMFASNFPVDKLFGSYVDTWKAFAAATKELSEDERLALFSANAERIYRI